MDEKNIVVVYGSGASYGSGYKVKIKGEQAKKYFHRDITPPTDLDFFKEINDKFLEEEYYALWKFKNDFFGSNSNIGMEQVWTALDLNFKHITLRTYNWEKETKNYLEYSFSQQQRPRYPKMDNTGSNNTSYLQVGGYNKYKFLGDAGRDFRRLIYNVYSNYTKPDGQQDLFKRLHKSLTNQLLGYITFNYDCYLEDSLEDKFKYYTANSVTEWSEIFRHGEAPIIKLHGSLNWKEEFSKPPEYNAPPYSKERQVVPKYTNDLEWSQPAIIPPTIFKQEINDDSRINNFLTQTILQQWRAAITISQAADIIIFVGYSFPDSDFHSKRIFQIANMLRRNDKKDTKILYCTGPKESKDDMENKIKIIFGENQVRIEKGFDKLVELIESRELEEFFQ